MAAMRLILGATRPDKKIDGAANFRVYLKQGYQANRGMLEYAVNGAQRSIYKSEGLIRAF
jgi:hypothetical protein